MPQGERQEGLEPEKKKANPKKTAFLQRLEGLIARLGLAADDREKLTMVETELSRLAKIFERNYGPESDIREDNPALLEDGVEVWARYDDVLAVVEKQRQTVEEAEILRQLELEEKQAAQKQEPEAAPERAAAASALEAKTKESKPARDQGKVVELLDAARRTDTDPRELARLNQVAGAMDIPGEQIEAAKGSASALKALIEARRAELLKDVSGSPERDGKVGVWREEVITDPYLEPMKEVATRVTEGFKSELAIIADEYRSAQSRQQFKEAGEHLNRWHIESASKRLEGNIDFHDALSQQVEDLKQAAYKRIWEENGGPRSTRARVTGGKKPASLEAKALPVEIVEKPVRKKRKPRAPGLTAEERETEEVVRKTEVEPIAKAEIAQLPELDQKIRELKVQKRELAEKIRILKAQKPPQKSPEDEAKLASVEKEFEQAEKRAANLRIKIARVLDPLDAISREPIIKERARRYYQTGGGRGREGRGPSRAEKGKFDDERTRASQRGKGPPREEWRILRGAEISTSTRWKSLDRIIDSTATADLPKIRETQEEFREAYGTLQEHYRGLRLKARDEKALESIATSLQNLEAQKQRFNSLVRQRLGIIEAQKKASVMLRETPEAKEARARERLAEIWRAKMEKRLAHLLPEKRQIVLDAMEEDEVNLLIEEFKKRVKL